MFSEIIIELSTYSILLPAIVGLFCVAKFSKPLRLLYWFVVAIFVLDISATITSRFRVNNLFIFHLYTVIEFVFILLIYRRLLNAHWHSKITVILILFVLFSLFNVIFIEPLDQFNSYQRVAEALLLMVLFYGYFAQLSKESKPVFLENHPYFLLTMGFLVYFTGTGLLFLFSRDFIAMDVRKYWMIHGILNIFLNGIYTLVLWKGSRVSMS